MNGWSKLITTVVPLGWAACSVSSGANQEVPDGGPRAAPVFETVQVTGEKLELTARLPGELTPYEIVAVYPRVTGFIEEVRVDRGSLVKKGEVLARLSAPELVAQRAEAESKLAGAKSTFERNRAAAETPGVVAHHDIEIAEAMLRVDQAKVDALKTLEGYLLVRAPFDGAVIERNVHPGALVGPPAGANSVPMLRIETVGRLRLTVAVSEADVSAIALGSRAEFTVKAWPGRRFSGVIRRISRSVDVRTRTMPVELDVDNQDGRLAPGMFADVHWPIRREAPSLLVPQSSVAQTTERTFVDRVKDGVIDPVVVQRGAVLQDRVEVYGDLSPGDLVLKRGSEELRAGARVDTKPWAPDGGTPK